MYVWVTKEKPQKNLFGCVKVNYIKIELYVFLWQTFPGRNHVAYGTFYTNLSWVQLISKIYIRLLANISFQHTVSKHFDFMMMSGNLLVF